MYLVVLHTIEKHPAARDSLPAFAAAAAAFRTAVDRIREAATRQHSGSSGAAARKRATHTALIDIAHPLGAALATWATVRGEFTLASRVQHTRTHYYRARDTLAASMARTVHTQATARLADSPDLADYGIDQSRLDTLAAALADYQAQIARPRAAIQQRKAATTELRAAILEADRLLRQQLDPLATLLATDYPAFAVDYRNTREIVNTGGRRKQKNRAPNPPPSTPAP